MQVNCGIPLLTEWLNIDRVGQQALKRCLSKSALLSSKIADLISVQVQQPLLCKAQLEILHKNWCILHCSFKIEDLVNHLININ